MIFQPKGPLGWIFVWRRVAWDNSVLRRFRAGRQVLALRTKDNSVRYSRGTGIEIATHERQAGAARRRRVRRGRVGAAPASTPAALLVVVPHGHDVSDL